MVKVLPLKNLQLASKIRKIVFTTTRTLIALNYREKNKQ
jgi:hypothetical protein